MIETVQIAVLLLVVIAAAAFGARRLNVPPAILVVAVGTGTFAVAPAVATFAAIAVGEIGYGIAIGWLMLRVRRAAADPRVEITLSLVTPYLAFWLPQYAGGSGVLATVAAGLYTS